MNFEAVIGLEVHAELATRSKMFCACPLVDTTVAEPNSAVCPVCSGMPGVLPVINQRAVEYALRVALALECDISHTSIFARKNYFYPDLPKGYQISQYENPLAVNGHMAILTAQGEKVIRIRRVHLEEDTGKLTHVPGNGGAENGQPHSLVDLNRAGVPLLEIVSEPDMRSAEEVRVFASALRTLLRYLEVNTGDMQKGVMRVEPNVSVRPAGEQLLGTRTEIKNLNSFRTLESAVDFEIQRQITLLQKGEPVIQETRGWDEKTETTFIQRSKEEEDDYRYFPEPDLPPLVIDPQWVEQIRSDLPELPRSRYARFQDQYGLTEYNAGVLTADRLVADFYEKTLAAAPGVDPRTAANWITGDLFALMNKFALDIDDIKITPGALAELITLVLDGEINQNSAKYVLEEMFGSGKSSTEIVREQGLGQISDPEVISQMVQQVLDENPEQVNTYLSGKVSMSHWLFGQVMRKAKGKANPQVVQTQLDQHLAVLKSERNK